MKIPALSMMLLSAPSLAVPPKEGPVKTSAQAKENALLAPWNGPFGGVPPFDKVKVSEFKNALKTGMAQNLAEIDVIANATAMPTFENTIVALEKAGQPLNRALTVFGVWGSSMSTPEYVTGVGGL
jgi:peptidyl-dipeptidase Dcp